MAKTLRQMVIDVLKPHDPSILEVTRLLVKINGISGINTVLYDVDKDVERVKLTVEGEDVPAEKVLDSIEEMGCTVHGVDGVAMGNRVVREVTTPKDKWVLHD